MSQAFLVSERHLQARKWLVFPLFLWFFPGPIFFLNWLVRAGRGWQMAYLISVIWAVRKSLQFASDLDDEHRRTHPVVAQPSARSSRHCVCCRGPSDPSHGSYWGD